MRLVSLPTMSHGPLPTAHLVKTVVKCKRSSVFYQQVLNPLSSPSCIYFLLLFLNFVLPEPQKHLHTVSCH